LHIYQKGIEEELNLVNDKVAETEKKNELEPQRQQHGDEHDPTQHNNNKKERKFDKKSKNLNKLNLNFINLPHDLL
jgi:FKBP-type peptidyl-prolyl cis-trans isomerase